MSKYVLISTTYLYYLENEELYYNYGKTSNEEYEWWKYNDDIDDWEPYFYTARKYYPSPLSESSERSKTLPFKGHEQYTYEKYNIKASHGYLDVHHVKPSQNYYYLHGNTYFFFDCRDNHRTTESTGWYIYNSSNEQWEFYAQYNDKNSIEDSLWYEPDIYSVPSNQKDDSIPDFENSSYYKEYDRLGLEEEYTEYLGNKIVCHRIPIRPGRNLAVICETAAGNHRQKKMGYDAARELYNRVQANMAKNLGGGR